MLQTSSHDWPQCTATSQGTGAAGEGALLSPGVATTSTAARTTRTVCQDTGQTGPSDETTFHIGLKRTSRKSYIIMKII